jgi:hypothetical protein
MKSSYSAARHADGRYDTTKPWNRPPAWSYSSPNQSNPERRTQEALAAATFPRVDLTDVVRPPMDIPLFRPKFGYRTRALSIADVIDVDEIYEDPSTFSGSATDGQGSARNAWSNGTW